MLDTSAGIFRIEKCHELLVLNLADDKRPGRAPSYRRKLIRSGICKPKLAMVKTPSPGYIKKHTFPVRMEENIQFFTTETVNVINLKDIVTGTLFALFASDLVRSRTREWDQWQRCWMVKEARKTLG